MFDVILPLEAASKTPSRMTPQPINETAKAGRRGRSRIASQMMIAAAPQIAESLLTNARAQSAPAPTAAEVERRATTATAPS
jgi:hypothetical protein